MPPRPRGRRPKKTQNARIDAAIETMKTEYGISDVDIIKKVLNSLLEEYGGGEEAWYFIELYTYQELFEGIVRYREDNPEENHLPLTSAGGIDCIEGNSLRIEAGEKLALENAAGSSTEPICLEVEYGRLVESEGCKEIGLDNTTRNAEEISGSNDDVDTGTMNSAGELITVAPPSSTVDNQSDGNLFLVSPCVTDSAPSRKQQHRWPCYGWIEDDMENDIDDFINLKPAKIISRKSRWDLRPEDP